jgi:hypothetical protein
MYCNFYSVDNAYYNLNCLMVEGIIGISDMLSITQTIGLVGTMVLTLIFSKNTYRVYQPTNKLEVSMT